MSRLQVLSRIPAFKGLLTAQNTSVTRICCSSTGDKSKPTKKDSKLKKANTPIGRLDDKWEGQGEEMQPKTGQLDPYGPFVDNKNPDTGEIGGPRGPEPTRYGDWERKGRVIDF